MKLIFLFEDEMHNGEIYDREFNAKRIRYQVSHVCWGSRMIDWFVEFIQDSVIFFFYVYFPLLKFKSFWTNTNTHTNTQGRCFSCQFLWHTIHCIIVSLVSTAATNTKSFNCQFIIIIVHLSRFVTLVTHFPWTSHPRFCVSHNEKSAIG